MSARRGRSVLCIGSEPVSLNLRCSQLRQNRWNVLTAAGGHEGVLRFQSQQVDAVVIDLNHDGSEAALIIAALKNIRPEIPVVMLVSADQKLAADATKQADAVLEKSRENERLNDVLMGITGRH